MKEDDLLRNKHILVVDDEEDVLEYVGEELSMCLVDKASDYETALEYIQSYIYDIVILDIMGVNGFKLLEMSVGKGFPTLMLTAHAFTQEALEKSIKLGAVSFLPKDKMPELRSFLEDVVLEGGRPVWRKLFDKLGDLFAQRFGPDWQERKAFFREFEEELKKQQKPQSA
jgi:CheY-like chemotaxis protein